MRFFFGCILTERLDDPFTLLQELEADAGFFGDIGLSFFFEVPAHRLQPVPQISSLPDQTVAGHA